MKKIVHAAFDAASMVAEWTAKDSVKLVHPFLRSGFCFCLPLPHVSLSSVDYFLMNVQLITSYRTKYNKIKLIPILINTCLLNNFTDRNPYRK